MISYNKANYFNDLKAYFQFLIDIYNYKLVREEVNNTTMEVDYVNAQNTRKIKLSYDIRDNAFYFYVIRGAKGNFPEPYSGHNAEVLLFHDIFNKYANIPFKKIQPDDKQYKTSLKLNAILLEKYGGKLLKEME